MRNNHLIRTLIFTIVLQSCLFAFWVVVHNDKTVAATKPLASDNMDLVVTWINGSRLLLPGQNDCRLKNTIPICDLIGWYRAFDYINNIYVVISTLDNLNCGFGELLLNYQDYGLNTTHNSMLIESGFINMPFSECFLYSNDDEILLNTTRQFIIEDGKYIHHMGIYYETRNLYMDKLLKLKPFAQKLGSLHIPKVLCKDVMRKILRDFNDEFDDMRNHVNRSSRSVNINVHTFLYYILSDDRFMIKPYDETLLSVLQHPNCEIKSDSKAVLYIDECKKEQHCSIPKLEDGRWVV